MHTESIYEDDIRPEDSASAAGGSRTSRTSSAMMRLQDARKEVEINERFAALQENQELDRRKSRVMLELEIQKIRFENELQETIAEIKREEEKLQLRTEMNIVKEQSRIAEELGSTIAPSRTRNVFSNNPPTSTPAAVDFGASSDRQTADILDRRPADSSDRQPVYSSDRQPVNSSVRQPTDSSDRRCADSSEWRRADSSDRQPADSSVLLASALDSLADRIAGKHDKLPRMLPEKFTGEYMEYPLWIKSFEALIEENAETVSQKLYFLKKCTGGEAYEAIKGLLIMNTEEGYRKAKYVLEQRYGDEYIISRDCIKKIKQWIPVKFGDGKALRKLSDFLNNCQSNFQKRTLDCEDNIAIILSKLPRNIVDRWSRIVDKWLHERTPHQYPPFSELCIFLEKKARVACINTVNLRTEHVVENRVVKNARAFSTGTEFPKRNQNVKADVKPSSSIGANSVSSDPKRGSKCVICNLDHNIEKCTNFLPLKWEEKREALKKCGLCFGCMEEKYLIKVCTKRQTCKICQGIHPTLLHRDFRDKSVHATSVSSDTPDNESQPDEHVVNAVTLNTESAREGYKGGNFSSDYSSMIIPVYVSHKDSTRNRLVYALLDEQSNSTFVSKETLEYLGVKGQETQIKLTTMLSSVLVNTEVVNGLSVVGVNSVDSVKLKSTYLREIIPVQRELIPRPENAARYKHLKHISGQIMQYRPDIEVGLLIGLDCVEAIKPRELISGHGNDPWAIRTQIGWGIAGVVEKRQND